MRRWVPRPIDLVVAALLTAATQVETWLLGDHDHAVAVAVSLAVGTAAFAWHRVAPVAALVVGITGLAVAPGALGVEPEALFGWFVTALALMAAAGYHARRPVVALAVALVLWALSIVVQKGFVPADIVFAWLLGGGAWVAGRALAGRTALAALSEQRALAAEQQAQWRATAAVAEERLRIAREMHDVVSHSLSVMTLHVSGVRRLLRPEQVDERAALETAERTGRESIAEMHRMLGVLRAPDTAAPAPGLARLSELLEPARSAGLQVECAVTGDVATLPPGLDLAAYRIVQEAVTNVLRHADARRIECAVARRNHLVELRVTDDGRGGAPSTGGHGLVGMRERAALYGGTVTAGPVAGGFAVHAVLPVPAEQPVARTPEEAR